MIAITELGPFSAIWDSTMRLVGLGTVSRPSVEDWICIKQRLAGLGDLRQDAWASVCA